MTTFIGGALSAPERSYPTSKVRGSGGEETPRVGGQGRPGEATSPPRPRVAAGRRHLVPEARGGDPEDPP